MPAGTVFKTGVYDNTVWNPLNPNDPPIEVGYGSLTTDEMFLGVFHLSRGTKTWCLTPSRRTWMVNDLDEEGMHVEAFPNPSASWRGADVNARVFGRTTTWQPSERLSSDDAAACSALSDHDGLFAHRLGAFGRW